MLWRGNARDRLAERLNDAVLWRAREPVFFVKFGVADTLDGRFDLVALHAWLVLDRLAGVQNPSLSQSFVDRVFSGFEGALRELGVSDIGMVKRMKALTEAFYGRIKAYEGQDEAGMQAALSRNLYRGEAAQGAGAMAAYVFSAKAKLAACDPLDGTLDFGPLPEDYGDCREP